MALSRRTALLAGLGGTLASRAARAQTLTPIGFALDFRALGRHAAWYVAAEKGFYRDGGLAVNIQGTSGTAQAIQNLESNVVQFAFSDVAGVATAHANGASGARIVAVIYQKAPYAIFSTATGANVTRPEQLEGLTIGSGAGSFTQQVVHAFMLQRGLDPSKVSYTNVDPAARISLLVAGKLKASESFAMSMPGLVGAVGADQARMLLLADFGLQLYSNSIVVRQDTIRDHPDTVRAFVKASLQGWKYSIEHPDEAAAIVSRAVKGLDPAIARQEIDIVNRLVLTEQTRAAGLGSFDMATMQASETLILGADGAKSVPVGSLVDADFLPNPPILP